MSFKDCIQTAVDSGRITEKKAREGFDAYDSAVSAAVAKGVSEDAAGLGAAAKAVEEMTNLKGAKQWQRINEMRKAHRIYQELSIADDPVEGLVGLMRRVDIAHLRIMGQAMSFLDTMILKYMPKMGGLVHPVEDMDDVVRAAFGDVRSAEAEQLAKSMQDAEEWLRQRGNAEGASVAENKKRSLPQSQDRIKTKAVSFDEWLNDIMEHGDFDLIEYHGKQIDEADRPQVLKHIYERIITNGQSDIKPGQNTGMNLANRLGRERFFYYKSADSWLYMQKKYGSGNVVQQLYGNIDLHARQIATMEVLGPSPNSMKEFAKRTAEKRAAELQVADPKSDWTSRVSGAADLFDTMYEIHNFHVLNGEESLAVQTLAAVRTYTTSQKLGGVLLSALPGDLATSKWAAHFHKLPVTGQIRAYIKHFLDGKISAQQAIRDGVIFQSGINTMMSHARYMGIMDGPHWVQRFSDTVYRAGLATHHTATVRHMNAQHLQGVWADSVDLPFDELPFMPSLERARITKEDWDLFRATPLTERDGATFLRPMDLANGGTAAHRRAADKFLDFMQMYIRDAVPEPDLRVEAGIGRGVTARSVPGQMMRFSTQLVSFPATLMYNHWKKIWTAPTIKDKITLGTSFFLQMTIAGAFITQAKALAGGQNPYDMTSGEFWGRAVLNGGSFGILGDSIFNNISIANSEYFTGDTPAGQYFNSLGKLTIGNVAEALEGKKDLNLDKDLLSFVNNNIPKLWFFKLLYERSIGDELMKEADPKAWQAKQRYLKRHEEGYWWKPGDEPAMPDWGTAIGQ